MSNHVIVISEWLPKKDRHNDLLKVFKELAAITMQKEKDCIRYSVTQQVEHPGAPGKSKFTIILIQEYSNPKAFDAHCVSEHVQAFAKKYFEDDNSLIEDWQCRLFSPEALTA